MVILVELDLVAVIKKFCCILISDCLGVLAKKFAKGGVCKCLFVGIFW